MDKIVIKIGGSLLSKSDEVLFDFLYFNRVKIFLTRLIEQDYKIALNVGGGYITRRYQTLAKVNGEQDEQDLHKIGVATTNLNAEIVHGLLNDLAYEKIIRYSEFDELLNLGRNIQNERMSSFFKLHNILVTAPSRAGLSNDWNALQVAKILGAKKVFDIKIVDGVYSEDPKNNPEAKRLENITWDEYFDIVKVHDHKPGANYPVDPITAKEAKEIGMEYVILGGEDFDNIVNAINNKNFVGTVIHS